MDYSYNIKVLSERDLIDAGCLNIGVVMNLCEKALCEHTDGKVLFPDKVSMVFDQKSQNRINCLPAGFYENQVYGMKWVSVFPNNPNDFNKPNVSAVILLSELETGYPIALLEGGLCTNLRTAAMGALAAKYLARKNSEVIGFMGAGEQAKTHFLAMMHTLENIKVCKVASRTLQSEENFITQMKEFYPEVEFIMCNGNCEEAAKNSDIIVTAISGQEKILQSEWIKEGAFYCHVGGLEDDFSVPLKASKIVCDDWESVKHRTQTVSQMYRQGLLRDEDIYANLDELIRNKKIGRENDKEFIYFNSVGLSFIDIKVATWMYEKAIKNNLGKEVNLKNESIFSKNEVTNWVK